MAVNDLARARTIVAPSFNLKGIQSRWHFSPFQLLLVGGAVFVSVLILLVPAYLLMRTLTGWENALDTLARAQTWQVMGNTLLLAGSVTLATAVLAVPLAWLTSCTDLPAKRCGVIARSTASNKIGGSGSRPGPTS